MWILAVIVGCGVPSEPECGDFLPLFVHEREWDYDPTGIQETLTTGEPWDAGPEATGYTLHWDLLENPDPPDVPDRDPRGELHRFTWQLSCTEGTVRVHDVAMTGETWEDDGPRTPFALDERYDPPFEVWRPELERGEGWSGSTEVTCTDDDGDCSRSLDWDIELDQPGVVAIESVSRERIGMSGDSFPWTPFERVEVIPGRAIWRFEMLGGREWQLDGISDGEPDE